MCVYSKAMAFLKLDDLEKNIKNIIETLKSEKSSEFIPSDISEESLTYLNFMLSKVLNRRSELVKDFRFFDCVIKEESNNYVDPKSFK